MYLPIRGRANAPAAAAAPPPPLDHAALARAAARALRASAGAPTTLQPVTPGEPPELRQRGVPALSNYYDYEDASTAEARAAAEREAQEPPPPFASALLVSALFWLAAGAALPPLAYLSWYLAVALAGDAAFAQYYLNREFALAARSSVTALAALAPTLPPVLPAVGSVIS